MLFCFVIIFGVSANLNGQVSIGKESAIGHLKGYTLILTSCNDYSEVVAARNYMSR